MRIIAAARLASATILITGGLAGGIAMAAPGTIYVSKANCVNGGAGAGSHQKPYCTVQEGVNAATDGSTINIQDGNTYTEQVVINNKNNLTIQGFGSTIKMPTDTTAGGSIIKVTNTTNLSIKNLNVTGPFNIDSCATEEYGISLGRSTSASLQNVNVSNIRPASDDFFGCQQGVGILIDSGAANPVSATLQHVTVAGYAKDGIEVNRAGASATIQQSTVTGTPTGLTALNGIQISRNATATLKQNTVSGNVYTMVNGTTASGILIYQAGAVVVSQNTLNNNDVAIDIEDSDNSTYTQNLINNSTTNGFYVANGASGNNFVRNSAHGTTGSTQYTPYDVEDDTTGTGTAGTANTWKQTSCETDLPATLCQ